MNAHLLLILGAAIGGLLADGMSDAELRLTVQQAMKSYHASVANPDLVEPLADMAISTSMDLLA